MFKVHSVINWPPAKALECGVCLLLGASVPFGRSIAHFKPNFIFLCVLSQTSRVSVCACDVLGLHAPPQNTFVHDRNACESHTWCDDGDNDDDCRQRALTTRVFPKFELVAHVRGAIFYSLRTRKMRVRHCIRCHGHVQFKLIYAIGDCLCHEVMELMMQMCGCRMRSATVR